MLAKVEQHVDERRAHLARGTQVMAVIALRPDRPTSIESAIDVTGTANAEALETPRKLRSAVCFGEQMHVVGLDREMKDAEAGGARSGQGAAQLTEDPVRAQGSEAWNRAQRDVNRMARVVFGST